MPEPILASAKFETFGTLLYPTTDGRNLSIGADLTDAKFGFSFLFRTESESEPNDVIAMTCDVADADGQIWRTRSEFLPEMLLTLINPLATTRPILLKGAADDLAQAFENRLLLANARAYLDDRFILSLQLGSETFRVHFKFAVAHIDLAEKVGEDSFFGNRLAMRVGHSEEGLYTYEDNKPVPPFVMALNFVDLLRLHSAARDEEQECWSSYLPRPLVFALEPGKGEPQEHILVRK